MPTAIIIVSYGGAEDVAECLDAIGRLETVEEIGVYIVENGGAGAYARLCGFLADRGISEVDRANSTCETGSRHRHSRTLKLPGSDIRVVVAEAVENLGYAAGVNSWLEQHDVMARWTGFWILNPDTAPEPGALSGLIQACESSDGGMAGSVILDYDKRDVVTSRGLLWRPWLGSVLSVGCGQSLSEVATRSSDIDAPSGTSFYVTRACLDSIGLMREDYFLYFEDVDWGLRAKAAGALRCADGSLVPHKHGASLGSALKRADRSKLSVYLDIRNMLLFTRRHDPAFLIFALLRSLLRAFEYLAVGSGQNFASALSGIAAGVRGEHGRPV